MKNIEIGLSEDARAKGIAALQQYLADTTVFRMKVQGFHWNVESEEFYMLHTFFEEQYEDLQSTADEAAERMRMLGTFATNTLAQALADTQLEEASLESMGAKDMLNELLKDHQTLIMSLRTAIASLEQGSDIGTVDYFTERIRVHEKFAWMTRAHLN